MDAAGNASIHELARCTVREALNALLDAEADAMCNAQHYERSQRHIDTPAGHNNKRRLHIEAGEAEVRVPK